VDFDNFASAYGWTWEEYESTPLHVLTRLRKYRQFRQAESKGK
jgi:hypothetical protein